MSAPLEEQRQRIINFEKFKINYGKANKEEKKKAQFYEKRLKRINDWWIQFDHTNNELQVIGDKSDKYFEENQFEKYSEEYKNLRTIIQNAYITLKEKMEARKLNLNPESKGNSMKETEAATQATTSSASNNEGTRQIDAEKINDILNISDDEMDEENDTASEYEEPEVRVLNYLIKEIKAAFEMTHEHELRSSSGLANAQLDNIKALWADIRATHRTILRSHASQYCDTIDMNELQAQYLKNCGKLNELAKNTNDKANVNLPKMKLPEFDGTSSWRAFKELFDDIVHTNRGLTDKSKAQYLKTALKGQAAAVVSCLSASEENYQTIYEALVQRYDNKRKNVNELIEKLLNIPKQTSESSVALRQMHDVAKECIAAIQNSNVDTTNWDPLVVHILMKKLSKTTILDYESRLANVRELQTLSEFLKYVENRFMALLASEGADRISGTFVKKEVGTFLPFKCVFCENPHSIYKCFEFKKLEPTKRSEWIKEKKACLKCLQIHTNANECKSMYNCKKCDKPHNTLLHFETKKQSALIATASSDDTQINAQRESTVNSLVATKNEDNLLATAMVRVVAKSGEKILLKAVIDPGSQCAMITEEALQLLRVPTEKVNASVESVEAIESKSKKRATIKISPRFTSNYELSTEALVLKKITNLSVFKGDLKQYEHLQNLLYADPTTKDTKSIDMLLGVAEYSRILKNGLIKSHHDAPIAQNTELGWLIMGPDGGNKKQSMKVTTLLSNVDIQNRLKQFFASESIDDNEESSDDESDGKLTEEEIYCENFFIKNTKRESDGRFVTAIPFRDPQGPKFGDSKKTALATLFQLEKRFEKQPKLKEQYVEAMKEAIKSGHMQIMQNVPKNAYYLPHHAVIKESSTTQVRPVYNASQKTTNGLSLNDQVAIGKMKQPKLLTTVLQWRKHKIGILADLEKMYKQIKIPTEQYHWQLILWRNDTSEKIKEYALTTVTFGVANSPYLAIRTLNELGKLAEKNEPLAAEAIKKCFYVDNFSGGANTLEEAIELYTQLNTTFDGAKFNLRKFASNSNELIKLIPEVKREKMEGESISALGIQWNPTKDVFIFKNKIKSKKPSTKRELFSQIATLFDPMGWFAPVIIKARILMQNVWKESDDWDKKLPENLINQWEKIKNEMPHLETIEIPRWTHIEPTAKVQLHGFCDASQFAYSACIFIKSINGNDVNINLLVAKTRVAPNKKKLTIPKLELCGALLLTKLTKNVKKAMELDFDDICLWSDSKVTLAWIRANPKKWKKFVATRAEKIQKLKNVKWCHIKGEQNPADCASRGIFANELRTHELWWQGPPILKSINNYSEFIDHDVETESEKKVCTLIAINNNEKKSCLPCVSSMYKLKRVIVYVERFIKYMKKEKETNKGPITVNELKHAEETIIKITQNENFSEEKNALRVKREIKKTSAVFNLSAFLDKNEIMRVGGRLKHSDKPFETRHPILIPKKSELTTLIIRDAHEECFHSGPRLTEAIIRKKFWIVHGASGIRKQLKICVKCKKHRPTTMTQKMGDLPSERVSLVQKPFANTMVDYTGAVYIKASTLRAAKIVKAYIAIFVCMATKAVHIEVVSDMTANAFIAALRRTIARRGEITQLFGDNGTNFARANRILQELSEAEQAEYDGIIKEELTKREITWNFSPPGAPHFNGLVEAAVKTTKKCLKKAIGEAKLTFEEMTTLLTQIEAAINSRPLGTLSNDPNDILMLTPAHFLLNSNPTAVSDENYMEVKSCYLTRWKLVQRMVQQFWQQWSNSYITELQVRQKWTKEKANIKLNDIVLIRDETTPITKWALARVINKYPGRDGLTRVVELKTKNGTLTRPIHKLCPLVSEPANTT